jgi:hypothetical protein
MRILGVVFVALALAESECPDANHSPLGIWLVIRVEARSPR